MSAETPYFGRLTFGELKSLVKNTSLFTHKTVEPFDKISVVVNNDGFASFATNMYAVVQTSFEGLSRTDGATINFTMHPDQVNALLSMATASRMKSRDWITLTIVPGEEKLIMFRGYQGTAHMFSNAIPWLEPTEQFDKTIAGFLKEPRVKISEPAIAFRADTFALITKVKNYTTDRDNAILISSAPGKQRYPLHVVEFDGWMKLVMTGHKLIDVMNDESLKLLG